MATVHLIRLPTGEAAMIDAADAELVSGFKWRLTGDGYVQAQHGRLYLYLHRLVAGAGPDELIDHANNNRLDNRRCNLRIASRSQNAANRNANKRRPGTSRYAGVCWDKSRRRWLANIHLQGKTRCLGRYKDEDEAARAYNRAALEAWGEFACLNDVPDEKGTVKAGDAE
jgi:hypothetical protein